MKKIGFLCCASEIGKIVANQCIDKGIQLSTVKLQKLLIMMHGVYFATYNKPLFKEKVTLMKHGVAIKEVDKDFRYEILYNEKFQGYICLTEDQQKVVDEVIKIYGKCDSFELNKVPELVKLANFLDGFDAPASVVNGAIGAIFESNILVNKLKFINDLNR